MLRFILQELTQPVIQSNINFFLNSSVSVDNNTVKIGDRVSFKLRLRFPVSTFGMRLEIFGVSNVSTILKVCDVKVSSVGMNLDFDLTAIDTRYHAKDKSGDVS